MLAAFLQQIGQVEVIAVKMDQVGILRCEGEELVKQRRFILRAVGEPLPDTPVTGLVKGNPDQIENGTFGGEAGRLDVHEQDLVRGRDPVQRVSDREILISLIICPHIVHLK